MVTKCDKGGGGRSKKWRYSSQKFYLHLFIFFSSESLSDTYFHSISVLLHLFLMKIKLNIGPSRRVGKIIFHLFSRSEFVTFWWVTWGERVRTKDDKVWQGGGGQNSVFMSLTRVKYMTYLPRLCTASTLTYYIKSSNFTSTSFNSSIYLDVGSTQ